MALINIHTLDKYFGDTAIISELSLQIQPGEKIGLVGANGTGKTTLLKIITGEEPYDGGDISFSKELTYGYLSQRAGELPQVSLDAFLKEALRDLYIMKEKLAQMEYEMAMPHIAGNKDTLAEFMEKYGELSHHFELLEGYNIDSKLKSVAKGLGFSEAELGHPISQFSGGEKTRAQLAALLLRSYELLLLDEPTNNLDMEAMEWLEGYLSSWKGALLVVSHDRFFLDRVVNKIALLENKKIKTYQGNYSAFLRQKKMQEESEEKALKKQQQILKKDLDFIRNASSEEIKRAQSRLKRVEKMEPLLKKQKEKTMKPRFDYAGRAGNIVLRFEKISKSFNDTPILRNVSFQINWGDRVAVVGPNGSGKSTILKLVTGELQPDGGDIFKGPSVKLAYYDQEQQNLNFEKTVLENILDSSKMTEKEARSYLGGYLFRGEDVFKRAGDLSSGEKSRLSLAKTTLENSNYLILDEPTNYLDIGGMEQLEKSLALYPGTMTFVSHDRFFIESLATVILEVKGKKARLYRCGYRDYLTEKEEGRKSYETSGKNQKDTEKQQRIEQREKEKQQNRDLEALKRRKSKLSDTLQNLEEKIHKAEHEKKSLEKKLAEPGIYDNFEKVRVIIDDLKAKSEQIKRLYNQWEETGENLDQLT